ncbi:hypothetical protein ACI65C_004387 [Semiaphis heraclei]
MFVGMWSDVCKLRIDKFLEGLASDGADLPVNIDKQIVTNKIDEVKTTEDLEVVDNNRTSTNLIDVEFVGKDSAVFQLLEDHENYGVYEHNPNECNWNVFYKTLPPGEQNFIKVEPKTEIVNDYFNTDSENKLETFSFNLENTQEKSIFEQNYSEAFSTGASTSEISYTDNELENFSFTLNADNIKEKPTFDHNSPGVFSTSASTSDISYINNEFSNFSDSLKADNIKEKSIYGQHTSEAISTGADTSDISYSDNELENFSFSLKADNNKKNTFRKPYPWHRKDSKQRNHFFQQTFKNQYQGNNLLPPVSNNNNKYKNTFRKPNPWYRKDLTPRNNVFKQTFKNPYQGNSSLLSAPVNNSSTLFPPKNINSQFNRGNSNNFKKLTNEIQENNNVVHSSSFTRNKNEPMNFHLENNNSQFIPIYIENPKSNTPKQPHLPPVPIVKPFSVVGEYLCPVSLVGTTIKFLSRKLANTSMREQIIIELATHGILENNWWTPDDMFYATFAERSIAQHVFKIYPHNSKSSY